MVIVFVEDNYMHETDGTAISAHRFRDELIKRGHTVRVLAIGVEGRDMYGLKEHYVPIVSEISIKNHMRFAKFDKKVVTEAFTGADLVHFFFPWQVERKCLRLARKMGITATGAFHGQPENITYNIKMKSLGFLNTFLYFLFKTWLYGKLENVHCPSSFIAGTLRDHKYYARLHTISNGVPDIFKPPETPPPKAAGMINVLMIGRLAEEKRQDLIIKAVKHSKYRDTIQLYFAGQGPMEKRYRRMSADLPHPPCFGFLPQDQLLQLIYKTDIYIHASDAEIEGIACMEAISCGKVPVISDSKKSATSQFALDGRSLFKKGKYLDLRDKLDYWIEHPEERERMGKEYVKQSELYRIGYSIKKIEKMFEDAVKDSKTREMIQKDKKIKRYNKQLQRGNRIKDFFCCIFYFGIAMPFFMVFNKCFYGLKIENKNALKKIKGMGAVTICNHIHKMDSPICATGIPTRKLIYVSAPDFTLGRSSWLYADLLGIVPTPSSPKELQAFIYTLSKYLRKGRLVHIYPEGELVTYCENLREFQRGAFYLAIDAQVPVLPMKLVCRKPDGILKFLKKKSCFTLVFGEPIYPNYQLHRSEAVVDIQKRAENTMQMLAV